MVDQDGFATKYEYDTTGRLYRLRDSADTVLVTYTYDSSGRLDRIDKGNGTFTTYEYDAIGQILSLKNWRNATELNSKFDYTYDSRGRRITMDTLDGNWTYGYDGTGQLIRAVFESLDTENIPNQDLQYFFDAVGNRTKTIVNGVETLYTSNSLSQYTSVGGVGQAYDADGNLTADGANAYEYDQQGRLVLASRPEGVTEYEYDFFGSRSGKVDNGVRTEYLNDPSGMASVIAELDSHGLRKKAYSYGLGLIGQFHDAGWEYFDFDALGSTAGVSALTGEYLNRYAYDPFGALTLSSELLANAFQFIGEYGITAELSGNAYMRARYYNATNGRFLTADPIRLDGGDPNMYRYAVNSPSVYIDPSGLKLPSWVYPIFKTADIWGVDPANERRRYKNGLDLRHAASACMIAQMSGNPFSGLLYANLIFGLGVEVWQVKNDSSSAFKGEDLWSNWAGSSYGALGGNCYSILPPGINPPTGLGLGQPGGGQSSSSVFSFDPNEKSAGLSFGPEHFVALNRDISFKVEFENYGPGTVDANGELAPSSRWATAPAQNVTISDFLSADFDWQTFVLTEVGFGDTLIAIPPNTQHYQTSRSMTFNGNTFDVLIEMGIRFETGEVYAIFQSIDPDTQLPPEVLTGFLPPEDGTGRGMGHFSYTVKPVAGLPTGHEIRNVALISFDGQLSIATDQVDPLDPTLGIDPNKQARITIDAGLPTSSLAALPSISTTESFALSWAGEDDAGGSGIAGYDVYGSVNNGPFQRLLSNTAETSSTFDGLFGNTYRFYSIAIDNTGQRQPVGAATIRQVELIDPRGTTVAVTSNKPSGSVYGQSVNFSVNVSPALAGSPAPAGSVQLIVDGVNAGAPVTLVGGSATIATTLLAAGNRSVTVAFASSDGNYDASTSAAISQMVNKAPLTVTAANQSKIAGAAIPVLTANYAGFVNGDSPAALSGTPSLSVSNIAVNIAGTYPISITAGTLSSANYLITVVPGTLTVTAAAPATLTALSGTPQAGMIGRAYLVPFKLNVKDAFGNSVVGAAVTFTAPTSGASGSFAGASNVVSVMTDAAGEATAPAFTANAALGELAVIATINGISLPFSASNVANATVTKQQIFYAGSSAFSSAGNAEAAIDPTRQPLLPGNKASAANYTNYYRGLNGIVIDVKGLPSSGIGTSDFIFEIWDGISAQGFLPLMAAPTVSVWPGQGSAGSGDSRVKVQFANNVIQNTWLRVTLVANSVTGLDSDNVFYFGNAIGDGYVANTATTVRVNAIDTAISRGNQSPAPNSAGVSNFYDLDKNGRVNAIDTALVRAFQSNAVINLITAPASQMAAPSVAFASSPLAGSLTPNVASNHSVATATSAAKTASRVDVTPVVPPSKTFLVAKAIDFVLADSDGNEENVDLVADSILSISTMDWIDLLAVTE